MTILCACNELDAIISKPLVEEFYQYIAFFSCKVASMVVFYNSILQRDDVASHSHVFWQHLVSYACGFERPASFVDFV